MARLIKNVRNGNIVEYDKGAFDDWCVYLTRPSMGKYAPKDNQYFGIIQTLGKKHGANKIYDDYVKVYNNTNGSIMSDTLDLITEIANEYEEDAEEIDIWFTVIYAGMIAEQNKAFTKLGKRVKRLGMYQILIENMTANEAANYSKGRKWRELDAIMNERGF